MPDFAGNVKNGLRADFVTPGKPAAMGGMVKGDIIVAIEDKPVNNIEDYMFRLSQLKQPDRRSLLRSYVTKRENCYLFNGKTDYQLLYEKFHFLDHCRPYNSFGCYVSAHDGSYIPEKNKCYPGRYRV